MQPNQPHERDEAKTHAGHAGAFDALLPREIAARAEDVGVAKAGLGFFSTFLLAVLAGAFIALGAVFSTNTLAGAADTLPFGVARLLAGLTFSLGLILVVVAGAELFTGNNLLLMAFASGKLSLGAVVRNWTIVYSGNFVGAAATALGMYVAGVHRMGNGQVGAAMLRIASAKCSLAWDEALVRGVYCNALVCLAVWLCMSCRTTGDRILAIIFPVTAFVAAGFEHSIANMYYVPAAMLVKAGAGDAWITGVGVDPAGLGALAWDRFIVANLVPVTLGNMIGGGLFVGAVYWVVYCRRPRA